MRLKIQTYKPRLGEMLFPPFANIILCYSSTNQDDETCLSSNCVTIKELQLSVERLKQELDSELARVERLKLLP